MRLLAIETSTPVCTIAAGHGSHLIEVVRVEREQLSRRIAEWTAEALRQARLAPGDVEVIIAGRGPGSWTGIRIGISFARAFAWATRARCVGVPAGEATAQALIAPGVERIVFATPARAGEVTTVEFVVAEGRVRRAQDEVVRRVGEVAASVCGWSQIGVLCGDGAELVRAEMEERGGAPECVRFSDQTSSAILLARYAVDRLQANLGSLADLSPIYAAPSQAERNTGVTVTS